MFEGLIAVVCMFLAGVWIGRRTAPKAKIVEVERLVDPDLGRRYQALEQMRSVIRGHVAARDELTGKAFGWAYRQPWYPDWVARTRARRAARDASPCAINDPRYWAIRASGKRWTDEGQAQVNALYEQLRREKAS